MDELLDMFFPDRDEMEEMEEQQVDEMGVFVCVRVCMYVCVV